MSKLIKELTKEWKEYKEHVEAERKKTLDIILEQNKRATDLWKEECDKIMHEPSRKCIITGELLSKRMLLLPPMPLPSISISNVEKPTMEGFMDYLTNKKLINK